MPHEGAHHADQFAGGLARSSTQSVVRKANRTVGSVINTQDFAADLLAATRYSGTRSDSQMVARIPNWLAPQATARP